MRVSTSQIYSIVNIGMSNAQTAINKTQEQMSTGKRVLSPADDPVASTTILQLNAELSRVQQYTKNIDSGSNSLNLEETSLQSVVSLIQRMQELAVQAGNTAVMSRSDYQALASEVESRTQELLNLQNTRNASGQYIFSGYQGSTQAFVDIGGGNYKYQGDDGQLRIQASATVTVGVSDSGKRIFVDVPSGHNTIHTSANPANRSQPAA
jgi:flagellar hook-associated protein 3 FlgL